MKKRLPVVKSIVLPLITSLLVLASAHAFSALRYFVRQPTGLSANQQYQLEIDYVRVASVPLPPALLLFSSALGLLAWVGRGKS